MFPLLLLSYTIILSSSQTERWTENAKITTKVDENYYKYTG